MKFSVAAAICGPEGLGPDGAPLGGGWKDGVEGCGAGRGSATVPGRLTRRRSVARGHLSWKEQGHVS